MPSQRIVNAVIHRGDEAGYAAQGVELPVVAQGATLDETAANLREAVALQLAGEDPAAWGIVASPTLVVTFELEPAVA